MKIDNHTYTFAGTSADPDGNFKARFANDSKVAQLKTKTRTGYDKFVLIELPNPMTKLEAIAHLKATKPEGVNLATLEAKEAYINRQIAKLNGTLVPGKRGRKPKNRVVTENAPESIVKTIVNTARGTSVRAKAAAAQAAKVGTTN